MFGDSECARKYRSFSVTEAFAKIREVFFSGIKGAVGFLGSGRICWQEVSYYKGSLSDTVAFTRYGRKHLGSLV